MPHVCVFRIYYEDTDAGGVVYHPNYLKFAERARTEMLRQANINQSALIANENIYFIIYSSAINFIKPAKLDDQISVTTTIHSISRASVDFFQTISINDGNITICNITTKVVCVHQNNGEFKPTAIPRNIIELMQKNVKP